MSGSNKSKSVSYQWSGPEQRVTDAGWENYTKAKAAVDANPWKAFGGERVADFNSDFGKARDALMGFAGGNADYGTTRSILDSLKGTIDPTKGVKDYMSPYLEAVLNPTLRKITEQGAMARNGIDSRATMAGAFGDTGHGVLTAQQLRDEQQNIGDATASLYDQGFKQATSDRNAERNLLAQLGQMFQGLGGAEFNEAGNWANMMASLSDKDRLIRQAKDDFGYGEFKEQQGDPFEKLSFLTQLLNSTPHMTTGANMSQQSTPNNAGMGLLGQIAGGILKSPIQSLSSGLSGALAGIGTALGGL